MKNKPTPHKLPETNEPALLRWSISSAAREFSIGRETLRKRLAGSGEVAADGTYTTKQICAAIYGDKEAASIRLKDAQAETAEIENAKAKGKLISVEAAAILNRRVATAIRQIILRLPLSKEQRQEVLAEIQRLKEVDFTQAVGLDDDGTDASS